MTSPILLGESTTGGLAHILGGRLNSKLILKDTLKYLFEEKSCFLRHWRKETSPYRYQNGTEDIEPDYFTNHYCNYGRGLGSRLIGITLLGPVPRL